MPSVKNSFADTSCTVSVADADPHQFGKPNPDPHQTVKPDLNPHQIEKFQKPDPDLVGDLPRRLNPVDVKAHRVAIEADSGVIESS